MQRHPFYRRVANLTDRLLICAKIEDLEDARFGAAEDAMQALASGGSQEGAYSAVATLEASLLAKFAAGYRGAEADPPTMIEGPLFVVSIPANADVPAIARVLASLADDAQVAVTRVRYSPPSEGHERAIDDMDMCFDTLDDRDGVFADRSEGDGDYVRVRSLATGERV
jgi:hypothetical protein